MRVFCLDWDSPDPGALSDGLAEGWLPNLAQLLERGAVAPIVDTQEILTPASWPTLNRGVVPARHEQIADRQLVPGSYRLAPVPATLADVPPFWKHLGDAGLRNTIVSIYNAPLLPDLPGTQVVGWGSHDPYTRRESAPRSAPRGTIRELERIVGRRTLHYGLKLPRSTEAALAYLDRTLRGVEQQGIALGHLMRRTEWDFFFGAIADGHEAGHVLWHHHDPGHPCHDPNAPVRLRRGLLDIYAAIDKQLGHLLENLTADDVVLVVTPYGMGPNPYLHQLGPQILEAAGHLCRNVPGRVPPGGDRRLQALALARRAVHSVVPAGLRPALGRLVPRDRLVDSLAFVDVDWSRTRAFAVWGDGSTLLRVNLSGREPDGTVSADRYEALRDDLIALFTELVDADTGEPVVQGAARFEEVGGGPVRGAMPDVCVQWKRGQRPRAISSKRVGELALGKPEGAGSVHWTNGFLIGAGPGIPVTAAGRLDGSPIRLVDFAATVFSLFGVRADALDGTPAWPNELSTVARTVNF
jgi:predicted AlkP superfamily phosphohydrolase/phosphomutase